MGFNNQLCYALDLEKNRVTHVANKKMLFVLTMSKATAGSTQTSTTKLLLMIAGK